MGYITELYQVRKREVIMPREVQIGQSINLLPENDLLNTEILGLWFNNENYTFDENLIDLLELAKFTVDLSSELNNRIAKNSFSFENVPINYFFNPIEDEGKKLAMKQKVNFELSRITNISGQKILTANKILQYYIYYKA